MKYDHIHREDILERFYNIPNVENMIAARQLLFIGIFVQDPLSDRPEKFMLKKSCNHLSPEQVSRPQYHNTYALMRNLCILFQKLN